jgi:hypothetical protein
VRTPEIIGFVVALWLLVDLAIVVLFGSRRR